MRAAAGLLALLLLVPVAQGWMAGPDRPHHADIAVEASQRLPAEWRALLDAHRGSFRLGALDPDGVTNADKGVHTFYHTWEPGEGRGGGVYRVELSLHEATMAIREGKSDADVAYQMGFLTHFITDLAMPFHTADGLYDHAWHETFEQHAYDHRDEYGEAPAAREPREVEDVEQYAMEVARASAALAPRLLAALERTEGEWNDEARAVAREAHELAVQGAADVLYTAFAHADPARPAPVFEEDMPLPQEPEDVGLSIAEIRKHHPLAFPMLGVALLVGIVLFAASRRRVA